MKLLFRGGNETVYYLIDRKKKTLKFASSTKTKNKLVKLPFWRLFDRGKERVQERLTDKLSDEQFIKVVVMKMANLGYVLQKEGFEK